MTSFKLKVRPREWMGFDLPLEKAELEALRAVWQKWLVENNANSIEDATSSNGVCLRVVDNDRTARLNGFDRLVLARALIAKEIRYEN